MRIELKVPGVGESIVEVQIGEWLKREGDVVQRDEALVEIESEKATVELPAPAAGQIVQILKQTGEMAAPDEVIGYLDDEVTAPTSSTGGAAPSAAAQAPPQQSPQPAPAPQPAAQQTPVNQPSPSVANAAAGGGIPSEPPQQPSYGQETAPAWQTKPAPAPAAQAPQASSSQGYVMPAAQRVISQHNIPASQVSGTGPGGRVLKEDVQRHVAPAPAAPPSSQQPVAPPRRAAAPAPAPIQAGHREQRLVPMSPIRRFIAQRLVEAQQTAALLTTFNEVDMTEVIAMRKKYRDAFQEKHEVKLGFMSFFVKATVDALKTYPQLNAQVQDQNILYHDYYDVGIAVGSGKGLVVPVLRNAEQMNFAEVEIAINDFASRARENRIDMDELRGGTFTISNGGVYGSMLSTPIINPPQSGILGLHAIQERPMAVDGQVVIRPMMNLALTYDHRIVDGREAVTFLRHIKMVMEDPARILLDV